MATASELSKYFNKGRREQVELNLGQQQLDPRLSAGGRYDVVVQSSVKAEDTSAGRLASALQQVSPALKAYANINYNVGKTQAAAANPEELEKILKKENPYGFLQFGRERGIREVGVKKDVNNFLLPALKLKEAALTNVETYPTSEAAVKGLDALELEEWEKYRERLGPIADSLEAKAVWQGVFSEFRSASLDNHTKAMDTYNIQGISGEVQSIYNAKVKGHIDAGTPMDYVTSINDSIKTFNDLGENAALTNQVSAGSIRSHWNNNVQTLLNKGQFGEAQRLLDALENHGTGKNSIFKSSENQVELSRLQKQLSASEKAADTASERLSEKAIENKKNAITASIRNLGDDFIPDAPNRFFAEAAKNNLITIDEETFLVKMKEQTDSGYSARDAALSILQQGRGELSDSSKELLDDWSNDYKLVESRYQSQPTQVAAEEEKDVLNSYQKILAAGNNVPPKAFYSKHNMTGSLDLTAKMQGLYTQNENFLATVETLTPVLKRFDEGLKNVSVGTLNLVYALNVREELKPLIDKLAAQEEGSDGQTKAKEEVEAFLATASNNFVAYQDGIVDAQTTEEARRSPSIEGGDEFKVKLTDGNELDLQAFSEGISYTSGLQITPYGTGVPSKTVNTAAVAKARADVTAALANETAADATKARAMLRTSILTFGGFNLYGEAKIGTTATTAAPVLSIEALKQVNAAEIDLYDFRNYVDVGINFDNIKSLQKGMELAVAARASGKTLTPEQQELFKLGSRSGFVSRADGKFNREAYGDFELHFLGQLNK
jgi:hypothetical protein